MKKISSYLIIAKNQNLNHVFDESLNAIGICFEFVFAETDILAEIFPLHAFL